MRVIGKPLEVLPVQSSSLSPLYSDSQQWEALLGGTFPFTSQVASESLRWTTCSAAPVQMQWGPCTGGLPGLDLAVSAGRPGWAGEDAVVARCELVFAQERFAVGGAALAGMTDARSGAC